MTEREKLITAIERAREQSEEFGLGFIVVKFKETDLILELLKEQEPVKPIRLENWWKCPACEQNIVANMKYCPGCGRKVKWDG